VTRKIVPRRWVELHELRRLKSLRFVGINIVRVTCGLGIRDAHRTIQNERHGASRRGSTAARLCSNTDFWKLLPKRNDSGAHTNAAPTSSRASLRMSRLK